MSRGRHALPPAIATLVALLALACAGVWLPATAGAIGTSSASLLASAGGPVSPAPPVLDDLSGPLARTATLGLPVGLGALGELPSARETMAFAAGKVAVGVVFLESDGSRMASTENWSREDPRWPGQDRRDLAVAQIQSALDWWNARSPDGSLEVFLPAAGTYGAPQTLKTGYEPISLPVKYGFGGAKNVLSDAAWRWEAMAQLGFRHNARSDSPMPERLYADELRRKTGADWAFIVYVVDSLNDRDGAFRNGAIAYTADLYGPYSMLTYDNDGYGFANFGAVLAHEMGHVFGALDEYAPTSAGYPSTGDLSSGYLGVRNRNAVSGGTTDLPCIMRGSNATLSAFARGDLCPSTIGQTGLRDSDGDTHPDVVDTRPAFTTGADVAVAGGGVTVSGTVDEQPWPHGKSTHTHFRHDISIETPHALAYRVDGGAWQPLAALDGAFDQASEGWSLTTGTLAAGHHELELEGTTGETAGLTRDLWAGPTPVTLELATNAGFTKKTASVTTGGSVSLYVRSTSGGFPISRLTPIRLVRVADHTVVARLETGDNGVWTGTLAPERTAVYVARFAGAGQFLGPVASTRVTIKVK